jgi:hypothetical protein
MAYDRIRKGVIAHRAIIQVTNRGRLTMKVLQLFMDSLRTVIENVGRIFKPNEDRYPATGVIPYTDDEPDQ